MCPDVGAVDDQIFQIGLLGGILQHITPDTVVTPAGEPLVDVVPGAVLLGQHAPLGAGTVNPDDRFQKATALLLVPDIGARMRSQECPDFGPMLVRYHCFRHAGNLPQMSTEPSLAISLRTSARKSELIRQVALNGGNGNRRASNPAAGKDDCDPKVCSEHWHAPLGLPLRLEQHSGRSWRFRDLY